MKRFQLVMFNDVIFESNNYLDVCKFKAKYSDLQQMYMDVRETESLLIVKF